MRAIAYALCFALIAIPAIYGLIGMLLWTLQIRVPYPSLLAFFFSFSSLVPSMLIGQISQLLPIVLGYVMTFLVLRRIWLFVVKKERTPASFVGFQKFLGIVGLWSFSLGCLALVLSIALRAGSGVPAGLLMIPATYCIPWAFFLTEVLSFRRAAASSIEGQADPQRPQR